MTLLATVDDCSTVAGVGVGAGADAGVVTLLATVDDCSSVAAQVHCETSVVAVRPIDTLPPASNALSRFS